MFLGQQKEKSLGKIHLIINPAAGTDEPVLSYIKEILAGIDYEINEARKEGDVFRIAKDVLQTASMIAVYGGDGSVCEAAKALHGCGTPMFILPGGTANVMSKEIEMPQDTKTALTILAERKYTIKGIDMGIVNGRPFLLRVNLGILSDMITETTPEMKDRWGQWAYGITAFREMPSEGTIYKLTVDGNNFDQQAVALTITNAGNIGKEGYSFLPGISITDGLLDVIALEKASLLSFIKLTGNILLHNESKDLLHWKAKEISITLPEETLFLCDDAGQSDKELRISVSPSSLQLAIPIKA